MTQRTKRSGWMGEDMAKKFLDTLKPDEVIVLCTHVIENPDDLTLVYHSEEGVISIQCDRDHDMENLTDFRWAHAEHLRQEHPILASLDVVPPNHVARYFGNEELWVIDTLL